MKKLDQKGIAHLGVLLAVLVVLAVGGVGWYVANRSEKKITSFEECVAAGNPVMESFPEQCSANSQTFTRKLTAEEKKKLNPETADWQTFTGLGLSVSYPKSWEQDKTKQDDPSAWAHFISPDYKAATDLGESVEAGHWLEVFIFNTDEEEYAGYSSYDEHLSSLKNTEQGCGGDYETSSIDSQPAIISDLKCHGSYVYATVYKNNTEYNFRLNVLDEDDPKVRQLFKDILSTVVLD